MRNIIVTVIIVILLALGAFLLFGKNFQPGKNNESKNSFHTSPTPVTSPEFSGKMHPFVGVVTRMRKGGYIIENTDGTQITILVLETTQYIGGTRSDIGIKKEISGVGKINDRGIITAKVIQISSPSFNKPYKENPQALLSPSIPQPTKVSY